MRRSLSLFLGVSLAVTGALTGSGPASAVPAAPASVTEPADAVIKVRERGNARYWRHGNRRHDGRTWGGDRYRYGGRHRYRDYSYNRHWRGYRHYRYHDDDDFYGPAIAAGIFGLGVGTFLGSQAYPYYGAPAYYAPPPVYYGAPRYGGGSGWIAACSQKYNSFDPRSGTYLGYDGYRHRCRLP